MCFHYSLSQVAQNLETRYHAPFGQQQAFTPLHHANGFAFPAMPVVTADVEPSIRLMRWGLVPSWTGDMAQAVKMRSMTLNARSETVFEKPSFRMAAASQRCLVPSEGFFEWQVVGNKRIPWFIRLKDTEIFSFAGIWDAWKNSEGDTWYTYSILTIDANPLMAGIHNSKLRMPMILDPANETKWLNNALSKEDLGEVLRPVSESKMEAWTVSNLITSRGANTNTPAVKRPWSWSELQPPKDLFS